jgi:diaminopimelate epimerase
MILFSKMQGTGNDFVVINCLNQYFNYSLNSLAKFICNRNFGVGADGVIYIFKSNIADFKMRIFNSDGSEAEMCGNGIRCMAKYLYEKTATTKTEFKIETLARSKGY